MSENATRTGGNSELTSTLAETAAVATVSQNRGDESRKSKKRSEHLGREKRAEAKGSRAREERGERRRCGGKERERAALERARFIGAGLRSGPAALCKREEPTSAWRSPDRNEGGTTETRRRLGITTAQKSARTCADHSRAMVHSHTIGLCSSPIGVLHLTAARSDRRDSAALAPKVLRSRKRRTTGRPRSSA